MKKSRNIICIAAHPDDEALGVGGTLIKHVNSGDQVYIVILSEGEESKSERNLKDPKRKSKALEWANLVGCKLYKVFNFPDQKLDTIPLLDIIQKLEKIFKELKPEIVYLHHSGDINHDHQIASQATLTALRPMNSFGLQTEIRSFETPSSTEQAPYIDQYIFKPNLFVSVEKEWKTKLKALKIYQNETGVFPHPRSLESIDALSIKRGVESGYKRAEAFYIIRKFWN